MMIDLLTDHFDYIDDDWDDDDRDSEDDDEWECCFPDRCLIPHFHHQRSECYDLEMAESLAEEEATAAPAEAS